MSNNPLVYDAGTIAMLNAFGALFNSGTMKVYTGSQPATDGSATGTLLVTMTFGSTAFATATASGSGGSMSANSITSGTAGNSGTAGWFAMCNSSAAIVSTGTCGATSGFDLNFDSTTITSGANVACSSFAVTQPQT